MLGISDDQDKRGNRKRKRQTVSFNEDEEIINPEDIDPSIGRFRNLIHTTVVPASAKRPKFVDNIGLSVTEFKVPKTLHHATPDLYNDLPPEAHTNPSSSNMNIYSSLSSRLGNVVVDVVKDYILHNWFLIRYDPSKSSPRCTNGTKLCHTITICSTTSSDYRLP